jgi:hypothetical protein
MKTHMTDTLEPDVHWYVQSTTTLPPMVARTVEDEERIQSLRDAGMDAQADEEATQLARRREASLHGALAQHYYPAGDDDERLRKHFGLTKKLNEYTDTHAAVPHEVINKIIELRTQKLSDLDDLQFGDHGDEPVFSKIRFWVSGDGEVLVVATRVFGEERQHYLLAQWRPGGGPRTSPERLRSEEELEAGRVAQTKAKKRRRRSLMLTLRIAVAVIVATLAIVSACTGNFSAVLPLLTPAWMFLMWPLIFGSSRDDD